MSDIKEVLKEDNKKALLLNLGIAFGIVALLIILFFQVYLPLTTDHGDTMKVPSIVGKLEVEASKILDDNKLRYEIIDSTYNSELAPLAVVRQYPSAGSDVKKKRKIYLTVNYAQSPTVVIPRSIITSSLRDTKQQLKRLNLKVGEIKEESAPVNMRVDNATDQRLIAIIIDGKRFGFGGSNLKSGHLVNASQTIDLVLTKKDEKNSNESNNSDEDDSNPTENPDNNNL